MKITICSASILAFCLLTACSPMSPLSWHTRTAPNDFVQDTRVLAEVIDIGSRQSVLKGERLFKGWHDVLMSAGYSDSDIVDGSEIVAWAYCYGHNSNVSHCAHHGHYRAHVPEALRGKLIADAVDKVNGDLVEIALTATEDGFLVGEVIAVYRASGNWGDCRYAVLQIETSVLTALTYGPPQGQWIECDDAETAGFRRTPVRGAPFSNGPPLSIWLKLPDPVAE